MVAANSINESTAGITGFTGTSFVGTPVTQYNVLTGSSTSSTINNVAPSATSGVPLISQGASSQPAFGTAVVAGGGTGATTLTSHGILIGQGTSAITALSAGTNGQVVVGSTGADPVFATLTSSDSSISFTTGAGTLSLQVAGGTSVGKTITGNSGGALSPTAGNWNILGTGSITTSGSGSSLTAQLTGLTNHNVLIGAGTATITNVAPSATNGIPLVSQGSSADPAFGTAVVAGGGTGATTLTGVLTGNGTSAITASPVTQYGVLFGGASNAVSSTLAGSTGQVLQANTSANPTFSTATYPSTAGTSENVLTSDGTNWLSSIPAVYTTQINLTNAQLKSIRTTPVTAISAQGNNSVIIIIAAVGTFIYGGNNPFTSGGSNSLNLYYNTNSGVSLQLIASNTMNGSTSTVQMITGALNSALTSFNNVPVIISSSFGDYGGNAANDNVVKIKIWYQLISW